MNYRIKDLPIDERPREKLKERGVSALSNEELIAIILKTGNKDESVKDLAIRLIKTLPSFTSLNTISYYDLIKIKGIKEAKALTLIAAIELGKRLSTKEIKNKLKITNASDVYDYFRLKVINELQEKLFCLFLNTKNEMINYEVIFIGTQNKSITHPREIFNAAIRVSAVKIILMHNHPTNDVTPSKEDIEFTNNIKSIGEIIKIPLIDNIIIGDTNYFSFYDHHLL